VILAATDDMLFDANPETLAERLRAEADAAAALPTAGGTGMSARANPSPLRYDRRAPESLIEALAPDGLMHELVQLVLEDQTRGLDLQLRADPRRPYVGRATLYIGLTKVLDVEIGRTGKFKLTGQRGKSFADLDPSLFKSDWAKPHHAEWLEPEWQEVMTYVRRAIECAPLPKVRKEGLLQAALNRASDRSFELVDREAVIAFSSELKKDAVLEHLRQPINSAIEDVRARHPEWARPKKFGDELDAIAIDQDGRVLIVEAKHNSDTAGLGLTPAQVALYLSLFERWAQQDPVHARDVLTGMVAQRRVIGLPSVVAAPIGDPLGFVPVIAVAGAIGKVAAARMRIVLAAVRDHGLALADLEIWEIDPPTGELRRINLDDA
jgi:hypothetical protein